MLMSEDKDIRYIVDPPSGHLYGFPKPYTPKDTQTFTDWLLEQGYPEKDLELANNYSKWWLEEDV